MSITASTYIVCLRRHIPWRPWAIALKCLISSVSQTNHLSSDELEIISIQYMIEGNRYFEIISHQSRRDNLSAINS